MGTGADHASLLAALRDRPMTSYQKVVVALCVLINLIDGFDILSISFAAPAVAREWNLTPERTGLLFSAGLAAMGLGALAFSFLADWLGRRPVIIVGAVLMTVGMAAAGFANSLGELAACRVVAGLGIGAMSATAGTLAIEYSSARWRTLSVALVVIGYPVGATVGGFIAVELLQDHGWRSIFLFGGSLTLVLLPFLLWRLPESVDFLIDRRPPGALERVNRIAARLQLPALAALPPRAGEARGRLAELLGPPLGATTLRLALAYGSFMYSFYFIQQWATSLVTRMGLTDAAGVTTSALFNAGGVVGGFITGMLAGKLDLPPLTRNILLATALAIGGFGFLPPVLSLLYLASVVMGFIVWSAPATLYSLMALSYPPRVRASAIGIIFTVGRAGSMLGPYVAGVLLTAGVSGGRLTVLMALPLLLAAALYAGARPGWAGRAAVSP